MEAKEFQKASAERIESIFRAGKQRRVLLADEVGLGKTIIAKEVIERVARLRMEKHDDMYRVVYVCSNVNIINQNTEKLDIPMLDISESRLSMQHLIIQEKVKELADKGMYKENGDYEDGAMPRLLIPLTPGTSFKMSAGCGNRNERALMFCILSQMDEFRGNKQLLYQFFKYYGWLNEDGWKWLCEYYGERVKKCGEAYLTNVSEKLRSNSVFSNVSSRIHSYIRENRDDWNARTEIIGNLRIAFAQISIEQLDPDLVIMDEFQRFSTLIDIKDEDKSDQAMLIRSFFKGSGAINNPLILLLSATPYKPLTTLEEINETKCNQQYEDFHKLTNFLFQGGEAKLFREIWNDYSVRLSHLETSEFDVIIASKKDAEEKMYSAMCRTERINTSIVDTSTFIREEPISQGDIMSYCQMQALLRICADKAVRKRNKIHFGNVPMDYVKSAPYLLSFMENYQLKKQMRSALGDFVEVPSLIPNQQLLLVFDRIYKYKELASNNVRLDFLKKMLFSEKNSSALLLWVPTSHPYYTTSKDNVFEINKDFSKVLVFSAWEMVPRMLAFMLSYEAERKSVAAGIPGASYTNKTGGQRLKDVKGNDGDAKDIMEYSSPFLSALYDPEAYFGKDIIEIKQALHEEIERRIKEKLGGSMFPQASRCTAKIVLNLAKWLDGEEVPEIVMNERAIDVLVNMAIGSPIICLYRRLGNAAKAIYGKESSDNPTLASQFVSLFNLRQAAGAIDIIYKDDKRPYYELVFEYCVAGNLQAVLDEFIHMIDEPDKGKCAKRIYESFDGVSPLEIDTTETGRDGKDTRRKLRTHYARAYTNNKSDENAIASTTNVRQAFNSPFRPFVLSTTSIGQEGLDFHWYCRKIVHWNIPSNPQDIEQREGRINRYKCLAIRRNIAKKFADKFGWKEMFDSAVQAFPDNVGGLIPFWCLPVDQFENPEMIERIVPMYPLSSDRDRYERMIDVLNLYRLTMGQPRQEELIRMFKGLNKDELNQLFFNLSPIKRK